MKTRTTKPDQGEGLQSHPEQFRAPVVETAKYLVILWQGQEQVVTFPMEARHDEIARYLAQECGEVKAISAGVFINEQDALWHGGESTTLGLQSRPQDRQLIQAFLASPDRRLWDLTITAAEAAAAAR